MNLCDYHEIQALLTRHGFRFSRAKGQNFLVRDWVPQRIAEESRIDKTCGVLEVGPGVGPLTAALCKRAGKVLAIEVDRALRPVLDETLAGFDNVRVIFGDVLRMDLSALIRDEFPGLRPAACANLPYYITTPVLSELLECRCFSSVTVMVQKEVAQRICAAPGCGAYGAFTVFCNWYAVPEMLFDVPPDCFVPRPKVTSAVLRLDVRETAPCSTDETLFFRVVRASFAQRRKTLLNGLAAGFPQFGKVQIAGALETCGISAAVRGETLGLSEFAAVANALGRIQSA